MQAAGHAPALASMGPRLRSRGRASPTFAAFFPSSGLQWGLGFAAEEGDVAEGETVIYCVLQWGLGFAAEEGSTPPATSPIRQTASMGPRLRSRGRGRGGGWAPRA